MSVVILVKKLSNGDVSKKFGGVRCDVEGCEAHEPQDPPKNLVALGWFIRPGLHRCPQHFFEEAPGHGVEHREEDLVTKRI